MDYSPFLPESHSPISRVLFWAVCVFVFVGLLGTLFVSGRVHDQRALVRACAEANVPDTARASAIDESGGVITLTWSDAQQETVLLPYEPMRAFEGCSESAKRVLARVYKNARPQERTDIKNTPIRVADSDRPSVVTCAPVKEDATVVVVRLRGRIGARECVTARQSDTLRIENSTVFTETVRIFGASSVSTSTMLFILPPRTSYDIALPVREYLETGAHRFMSDPSLSPEVFVLP